ncbi:GAF and ANTAR domain-containing protein [Streptomyces sp. NPDC005574]|uniref:GAF and ANTAR domain-containing protein n=1 Tax=Streptomyces sp. NPDC005574 TaxID=3156891 RepID=UPI0033B263CE
MNRELRLTRAFVDLADTLGAYFDPLDLFARLGDHCVALLEVDAVGVVMADARGRLRTMAASADDLGGLDVLQVRRDEGPSVDCYRTGEQVTADDLRADGRWPAYTAHALESGCLTVHALPLRLDGTAIGAVTLANRRREALPDSDLAVAQGLSDIVALTLTHWPAESRRPQDLLTSLQAAVSAKATVELAKGLLAEYADVSLGEALDILRRHAENTGTTLTAVARRLAERTMEPAALFQRAAGRP